MPELPEVQTTPKEILPPNARQNSYGARSGQSYFCFLLNLIAYA